MKTIKKIYQKIYNIRKTIFKKSILFSQKICKESQKYLVTKKEYNYKLYLYHCECYDTSKSQL